jgi:hypothetical protein
MNNYKLIKYTIKNFNSINNKMYIDKLNYYLHKYTQTGGTLETIISHLNTICDNNIDSLPYVNIYNCDAVFRRLGNVNEDEVYKDTVKYETLETDEVVAVYETIINDKTYIIKCEQLAEKKPTREAVLMLYMKNFFDDDIIKLHFLEIFDYFITNGKCIGKIRPSIGIYEYKIMDKCDGTLTDYLNILRRKINPISLDSVILYLRKVIIILFQILYSYRKIVSYVPFFIHGDLSTGNILYNNSEGGNIQYPYDNGLININLNKIDNIIIKLIDYGMYATGDILQNCRTADLSINTSIRYDICVILHQLFLNKNIFLTILNNIDNEICNLIYRIIKIVSYNSDFDMIIQSIKRASIYAMQGKIDESNVIYDKYKDLLLNIIPDNANKEDEGVGYLDIVLKLLAPYML